MTDRVPHDFAAGEKPTAAMFDALAAGELNSVKHTTDVAFTTEAIIADLATWVQVPQSRRVKITAEVCVYAAGTNVVPVLRIFKGVGTQIQRADAPGAPSTAGRQTIHTEFRTTQAAGSLQYYATIENGAGTATAGTIVCSSTAPAYLVVDDMGSVT